MKETFISPRRWAALLLTVLLMLPLAPTALADTDETTPRITKHPDQLVLQLGTRWAGVEFELRTDAGKFPVPVVVDETGVLTMDLGGSSTYTLSCLEDSAAIPDPGQEPESAKKPMENTPALRESQEDNASSRLLLVLLLLLLAVIVIAGLVYLKHQRRPPYDDWENDEDAL